jgi:hypothetical protein
MRHHYRGGDAARGEKGALFVAGGWYEQEDDIESHLLDLGHDVTVKADYQVYGSTDPSVYERWRC